MRKPTYKPLSFSTTMRNPERIAGFISCLLPYEGKILNNEIIHEITVELISKKYYHTQKYEMKVPKYKEIYKNIELSFTRQQVEDIIRNSPQNHKEAGFDKGWPSRFATWYDLPKELGFVKFAIGQQIIISQTGHMLIDAFNSEQVDNNKIKAVFLNAMMKYQTNNPYRRTLNANCPMLLLLNLIMALKEINPNDAGVSRKEIPIILCWPNDNTKSLLANIQEIRKSYGFNVSDEIIYDRCMKLLGAGDDKKNLFKISKIMDESVDEFIRKMRITGIFSLRGMGRFLDINKYELEMINYIIANYMYKEFETVEEYFEYISSIDLKVIKTSDNEIGDKSKIREDALIKWASKFTHDEIATELNNLSKNKESKNLIIRLIDKPTRFEFLTSISLKQQFNSLRVIPNYNVDDEGLPTFTAAGGMADIECFDDNCKPIVEVTLMTQRTQGANEIPAITRHLLARIKEYNDSEVFALFIAPYIHEDTSYMIDFSKYHDNVIIVPYTIQDYMLKLGQSSSILQMKSI